MYRNSFIASVILQLSLCTISCLAQENCYRFSLERSDGCVYVHLESIGSWPCRGYQIRNTHVWSGDTVVITINGFIRPSPCIQGFEVAKSTIALRLRGATPFYLAFQEDEFQDLWLVELARLQLEPKAIHTQFTALSE